MSKQRTNTKPMNEEQTEEKVEGEVVNEEKQEDFDTNADETVAMDAADIGVGEFIKAKWNKHKGKIVKGGAVVLGTAAGLFILNTLLGDDEDPEGIDGGTYEYVLKNADGDVIGTANADDTIETVTSSMKDGEEAGIYRVTEE